MNSDDFSAVTAYNRLRQGRGRRGHTAVLPVRASAEVVVMSLMIVVVGLFIAMVFLMIMGTSGFVFFNVFRNFGRVSKVVDQALDQAEKEAAHSEKKRRALEIVANQAEGTPAYKCKSCGAIVDSTAELSADGRIRCNYCNQWASIYQ